MPCYEPPAPYEGKERDSANNAVKILCGLMTEAVDSPTVDFANPLLSVKNLTWFIEHRGIDREIALSNYYKTPDPVEARKIELHIAKIQVILNLATTREKENGR